MKKTQQQQHQQQNKPNNNNNNKNVNNKEEKEKEDLNKEVEEMYLTKEELNEDIIIDKRKILDLDQRNNLNIEALDNIVNTKTQSKNGKLWIYTGDIFIQMKESSAKELIIKENDAIEEEITNLQNGLKQKQDNLIQLDKDYQRIRNKLFA